MLIFSLRVCNKVYIETFHTIPERYCVSKHIRYSIDQLSKLIGIKDTLDKNENLDL